MTHSPADILPALEVLSKRLIEVLAINRGDGTVAAILGRLLEGVLRDDPWFNQSMPKRYLFILNKPCHLR